MDSARNSMSTFYEQFCLRPGNHTIGRNVNFQRIKFGLADKVCNRLILAGPFYQVVQLVQLMSW